MFKELVIESVMRARHWITFYNHQRPHTANGGQPPAVAHFNSMETDQQAQRVT